MMPFKVIRCRANRSDIEAYDFLLALNSNLTSIFNRSWDITSSLHIHTPPPFYVKLGKRRLKVCWHGLVSGCQEHWMIGLSDHRLKSALTCTVWSQYMPVPVRQTDRQTNIMTLARRFVLTNISRAKNLSGLPAITLLVCCLTYIFCKQLLLYSR